LVCFGERTWVRLKEAVRVVLSEKRVKKWRRKEEAATRNKGIKTLLRLPVKFSTYSEIKFPSIS